MGVQVGGLSLAGSTRTANTLRLCAVRRLKKRGWRRRRRREATARTCILAKGNGAHRAGPVPQSASCSRRAAFKVHTSLRWAAGAVRDSQMEALAKPLHASHGDKTAEKSQIKTSKNS